MLNSISILNFKNYCQLITKKTIIINIKLPFSVVVQATLRRKILALFLLVVEVYLLEFQMIC